MPSTQVFKVSGMSSSHCACAVRDELTSLPGIRDVEVHLVRDGESTLVLTLEEPVATSVISRAEAGCDLAG